MNIVLPLQMSKQRPRHERVGVKPQAKLASRQGLALGASAPQSRLVHSRLAAFCHERGGPRGCSFLP